MFRRLEILLYVYSAITKERIGKRLIDNNSNSFNKTIVRLKPKYTCHNTFK